MDKTISISYKDIYNPTMHLKWIRTEEYIPELDCYEFILVQKWISLTGQEEWREIEIED